MAAQIARNSFICQDKIAHWVTPLSGMRGSLCDPSGAVKLEAACAWHYRTMKWLLMAVGVGVLAALVYVFFFFQHEDAQKAAMREQRASVTEAARLNAEARAASQTPVSILKAGPGDKAKALAARDQLIAQVEQARQRRVAAAARAAAQRPAKAAPAPGTADAPVTATLDRDYIRARMMEIRPLLVECYETAMATHPELEQGGQLTVTFKMAGEPEVGGVVLDSEIVRDKSTLADSADMADCVRESMYAMRFDPPAEGGEVTVNYPFIFKTSDGDEPEDSAP